MKSLNNHEKNTFLANVMTWREAQEECERLGGYLAEIGSEEEQTFLVRYLLEKCKSPRKQFWLFIL